MLLEYKFLNLILVVCLVPIICNSCQGQKIIDKDLNTSVEFSDNLNVEERYLTKVGTVVTDYIDYTVDDKNQAAICNCINDRGVIEIKSAYTNGMSGEKIYIYLSDSTFYIHYNHFGDISPLDYNCYPIKQKLIISKYKVGADEELKGEFFFKGLGFTKEPSKNKVVASVNGKFHCKIKKGTIESKY